MTRTPIALLCAALACSTQPVSRVTCVDPVPIDAPEFRLRYGRIGDSCEKVISRELASGSERLARPADYPHVALKVDHAGLTALVVIQCVSGSAQSISLLSEPGLREPALAAFTRLSADARRQLGEAQVDLTEESPVDAIQLLDSGEASLTWYLRSGDYSLNLTANPDDRWAVFQRYDSGMEISSRSPDGAYRDLGRLMVPRCH
jgi:hypothetical protein